MKTNNRLSNIAEYHFKRIEETKESLMKSGRKIYDFGIGDPDLNVHPDIINSLIKSMEIKNFNKYPPYEGIKELKLELIQYYDEVFNVKLKLSEVVILIGSKEGLNNIIPAVCDFGDTIIVPTPGYPVYETSAHLWGVNTYKLTLREAEGYLPQLQHIPSEITSRSKMLIINYPNNPTGAIANSDIYKDLINYCNKNDVVLCNDSAYNEIIKYNNTPLSILQTNDKRNCIEFGSFSKTFNMTGFRIGYAVGDEDVIKALVKVKSNVDSGQFLPIQYSAIQAIKMDRSVILRNRLIYDARRTMLDHLLTLKKIQHFKAEGAFYIWCKVPGKYTTDEFCEDLLNNYGIVITPGYTFGTGGNDYFRIALTQNVEIIQEAFDKVRVYN